MKRLSFIIILFVISAGQNAFVQRPTESFHQKIVGYINTRHDSLKVELVTLRSLLDRGNIDSAQKVFLNCRTLFKKTEAFVSYYFPGDQVKINGENIYEIEDTDEPLNVIPPHGFQVIEGFLFGEQAARKKPKLLNETDSLIQAIAGVSSAIHNKEILPRNFFEALQIELIRVFTLTAIDFETPESKHGCHETITVLASMKELLNLAYPEDYNDRSMVLKIFSETLDATIQYLMTAGTSDKIDFIRLYSQYYIPLSDQLRTARGNLTEGDYQSTAALNLNERSVFDLAAFNTFFFNPVQRKISSPELASLGRTLFFDPILSENNERSCASCHRPDKAFTDGLPKSISIDPEKPVTRNSPTLVNAALQGKLFHDARALTLEAQAGQVLNNPVEMHHDFDISVKKIKRSPEYFVLFNKAFKGTADTNISDRSIITAIAEYERTLISFNSRFDKSIRQEEDLLTPEEKEGFHLFITKGNCASCHFIPIFNASTPPLYQNSDWEILGVPDTKDRTNAKIDPDPGRAGVYTTSLYLHAFKTPTLRNIEFTGPYMHNGVFETLEDVMDFYNAGGGAGWGLDVPNQTLSPDSLQLTQAEIQKIISFMKSLSDTTGLSAVPDRLPSFPKNPEWNNRKIGGSY